MKLTRRELSKMAGTAGALALGWERAVSEAAQTGEVSRDTVLTLLDAQGERGIYEDREELERLRVAVSRFVRVQRTLREYPISDDQEPALVFKRD